MITKLTKHTPKLSSLKGNLYKLYKLNHVDINHVAFDKKENCTNSGVSGYTYYWNKSKTLSVIFFKKYLPRRYIEFKLTYFAHSKVLNRPNCMPQFNLERFFKRIKSFNSRNFTKITTGEISLKFELSTLIRVE